MLLKIHLKSISWISYKLFYNLKPQKGCLLFQIGNILISVLSYHNFRRPFRLNKCLYGADFSGKSWHDTLDSFCTNKLSFQRSRVDGCLYIYRKGNDRVKLINYVDDALQDYASSDRARENFELSLKNRCNLSLLGEAKWYLGMRIIQSKDFISIIAQRGRKFLPY